MKHLIDPKLVEGNAEWEHIEFDSYVKKPIPIGACQMNIPFTVRTIEGTMTGKAGDYLVRGVSGDYYICDKDIFEESYENL